VSWIQDAFGDMPQRPDTPEFWALMEIIYKFDGRVVEAQGEDAKEAAFTSAFEGIIDPKVVAYTGFQRALRVLNITTRGEVMANMATVAAIASAWMEAFAMGAQWQKR
jgi:hypothetical protein